MTAASKHGSPQKLLHGGFSASRTFFLWGETGVLGEETDECNRGKRRGMGPSTYTRVMEITSGGTISQQGLAATCKDPVRKGRPEAQGGFWFDAWARMSCEGEVTLSEATSEVVPMRSNTLRGQRSPGHSVAVEGRPLEGMAGPPVQPPPAHLPDETSSLWRGGWQTAGTRGVCAPALELQLRREGRLSDKWQAEPRPEPDSGNPTVRDCRGALRNVNTGFGPWTAANSPDDPPDLMLRALNFYPDNCLHGSKGECGDGLAGRAPRR
jgi:hypothetical protein